MTKLQELEKRLKREPDNLVLRVMVATALREAGRSVEAVELYRSVALAYRDQGRQQQAIAVCRSVLEIAPEDSGCQALLASLTTTPSTPSATSRAASPSQPPRRSSFDATPLPKPVPHHVADPTSSVSTPRIDPVDVHDPDLPAVEGAETRPGAEDRPQVSGLAEAARRISGLISSDGAEIEIDLASELDTRKVQRIEPSQLQKILGPPPTVPVPRVELTPIPDDAVTPVTSTRDSAENTRDSADEVTSPRELFEPVTKKKPDR